MTRSLLIVLFALVASSAFGQTVERTIDLSQFGGGFVRAYPIETDGDINTEEWLVMRFFWPSWESLMVVAVRPEGFCFGPWFGPPLYDDQFDIIEVRGRSKIRSFQRISDKMTITALETPACVLGEAPEKR